MGLILHFRYMWLQVSDYQLIDQSSNQFDFIFITTSYQISNLGSFVIIIFNAISSL